MQVDKTFGKGWSSNETTELDDLAFFLHLKEVRQTGFPFVEQEIFIEFKDSIDFFNSFYKRANVILRTEKINKIKNGYR